MRGSLSKFSISGMNLVDATYQTRNAGSLAAAVREVNRIVHVFNLGAHEFAAKPMDEVGRMMGGWLKGTRQRKRTGELWQRATSCRDRACGARVPAPPYARNTRHVVTVNACVTIDARMLPVRAYAMP
jgi:hypothetical protein